MRCILVTVFVLRAFLLLAWKGTRLGMAPSVRRLDGPACKSTIVCLRMEEASLGTTALMIEFRS